MSLKDMKQAALNTVMERMQQNTPENMANFHEDRKNLLETQIKERIALALEHQRYEENELQEEYKEIWKGYNSIYEDAEYYARKTSIDQVSGEFHERTESEAQQMQENHYSDLQALEKIYGFSTGEPLETQQQDNTQTEQPADPEPEL